MKYYIALILGSVLVLGCKRNTEKCDNYEYHTLSNSTIKKLYYSSFDKDTFISSLNDTLILSFNEMKKEKYDNYGDDRCIYYETAYITGNVLLGDTLNLGYTYLQISEEEMYPGSSFYTVFKFKYNFSYNDKDFNYEYSTFYNDFLVCDESKYIFYETHIIENVDFNNVYELKSGSDTSGIKVIAYFSPDYGFIEFLHVENNDTLKIKSKKYFYD
jgi:hypothetical protein